MFGKEGLHAQPLRDMKGLNNYTLIIPLLYIPFVFEIDPGSSQTSILIQPGRLALEKFFIGF